ncbi:hypothetical protein B9N43_04260 [Denitratisoma sp. DHT3]|uniref:aldo/keto reductase n=1 Tax=Denitratisoma sp. DHT3 TaxID=1981880 RepID=UPI001198A6CD|nr:aldo/keto reductase [Denitratisoma sp. DHT3]QDX80533.1 hypothetical protein B9N43_04260 [Denitratisoma sp. DHT3]
MPDLARRRLGSQGPLASAIGFGAAVLSPGYYEPVEDAAAIDVLRYALDCGINLIDTSNVYGLGHNETLVGRAVAGRRDQVLIASKFGWVVDGSSGSAVQVKYDMPGIRANGHPAYVHQCIDESLRRLDTDYLDLYYQHFPDPAVPVEETVGAMADLVRQGKVRHLGLCNVDAATLERAQRVHPIAAVQNEFSLWARQPERELLPAAERLGVALVTWCPLGSGFLAQDFSEVHDYRCVQARFKAGNLAENRRRFEPLRQLAGDLGISEACLALAWLLHRGPGVVPIPGMTQRRHVDDNLTATTLSLDAATLARIDVLAPPGLAVGDLLF